MFEVNPCEYAKRSEIQALIKEIHADQIYIYSMLENIQKGRMFVDSKTDIQNVLFWHYCGFAYVAGTGDNEAFNQELGKFIQGEYEEDQSRFILAIAEPKWKSVVEDLKQYQTIYERTRYQFKFNKEQFELNNFSVPSEFELKEIDEEIINKLQGRIIPSFSWDSSKEFLEKGKGLCLLHKGEIACNAFSAAIGNGQMDIGVETNPNYRGKGLGKIVAAWMVNYALEKGYEPIWGCDSENIGSSSIAQAIGYEKLAEHSMYMK